MAFLPLNELCIDVLTHVIMVGCIIVQYKRVFLIFPLILQRAAIAQMLPSCREWVTLSFAKTNYLKLKFKTKSLVRDLINAKHKVTTNFRR